MNVIVTVSYHVVSPAEFDRRIQQLTELLLNSYLTANPEKRINLEGVYDPKNGNRRSLCVDAGSPGTGGN